MRLRGPAAVRATVAAILLLALAACTPLDAVTTVITTTTTPATVEPDGKPLVAFYGDSYTYGAKTTSPSKRWSTLLSADRGWIEYNRGVPGLGFLAHRGRSPDEVQMIVAAHPDIVVVMMGINDLFNWNKLDHEALRLTIGSDFDALRAGLPTARIIVVEPMWPNDARPAAWFTLDAWERDAAVAVNAEFVQGASLWLASAPHLVAPDGIHPDDAGHALIAARLDAAIGPDTP